MARLLWVTGAQFGRVKYEHCLQPGSGEGPGGDLLKGHTHLLPASLLVCSCKQ